jgi:hypothetical protein
MACKTELGFADCQQILMFCNMGIMATLTCSVSDRLMHGTAAEIRLGVTLETVDPGENGLAVQQQNKPGK